MKEIMEVEGKCSIRDVDHYKALKESWIAYSNVSASQSTTIPSPKKNRKSISKPSQDYHDSKKLKTCNERWSGLGCVKVYKLATMKERREHLKKLKLCSCCRLSFH